MSSHTVRAVTELAAFVAGVRDEDVPPATRRHAGTVLADTLAVGIRGSMTRQAARLLRARRSTGESRVLTPGFPRVSAEEAAMLNAVAICSTELDEGTRPTGHPAMHVIPPTLALAQSLGTSGTRFLTAFILGYEIQARIQRAARLRPRVHCHGNFGHAGVAGALARLTGRSAEQVMTAINGAAAFASATSYSLPYTGASMHAASPSLSGSVAFLALRLADAGYTAHDDAVAEVFGQLLGTDFASTELTADLGTRWAVDSGYTKFHSACGHVHPVLEALVDAFGAGDVPWRLDRPVDPATIERIEVRVGVRAAELSHLPHGGSALSARFSIPYATAAFLAHGAAHVDAFEPPAVDDARVLDLASRVVIVAVPRFDEVFPDVHRAEVEVVMLDGSARAGRCDNPYGNAMRPASLAHVRHKFDDLLSEVLAPAAAQRLWESATGCDNLDDVRMLTPG